MTLSEIRSALTQLDLVPSKGLGQNFLHDQNLARWFADQVSAEKGDHVIEIGPGLGAITEFLIRTEAKVSVIERAILPLKPDLFVGKGYQLTGVSSWRGWNPPRQSLLGA